MKAYLVFFLTVSVTLSLVHGFVFTKFLSAKCIVLDPKSIELNYCFVKSYSRTNTVINIGVNLLRTLDKPGYVSSVMSLTFSTANNFRRRFSRITSMERCSGKSWTVIPLNGAPLWKRSTQIRFLSLWSQSSRIQLETSSTHVLIKRLAIGLLDLVYSLI